MPRHVVLTKRTYDVSDRLGRWLITLQMLFTILFLVRWRGIIRKRVEPDETGCHLIVFFVRVIMPQTC